MDNYYQIAKQYFQNLEGLHLYPSSRSLLRWVWIAATIFWLGALAYQLGFGGNSLDPAWFVKLLVPEIFWLAVTFKIQAWKESEIIKVTNSRFETSFTKTAECRSYILAMVSGISPIDYLKTAKEIDDLLSLNRKFQKRSDLAAAELMKSIYDRDSKGRLIPLILALISVTVAFAVRGDANLETIFNAFSDAQYRVFLGLVAALVALLFLMVAGLRIFFAMMLEVYVFWRLRFLNASAIKYTEWLLSYLGRDLVRYHRYQAIGV